MQTYLNNLLEEKNLQDEVLHIEGESGTNFMPLEVIVEHILIAPKSEQKAIRKILVQIDFKNGDVLHFFTHLAKAIAI